MEWRWTRRILLCFSRLSRRKLTQGAGQGQVWVGYWLGDICAYGFTVVVKYSR